MSGHKRPYRYLSKKIRDLSGKSFTCLSSRMMQRMEDEILASLKGGKKSMKFTGYDVHSIIPIAMPMAV